MDFIVGCLVVLSDMESLFESESLPLELLESELEESSELDELELELDKLITPEGGFAFTLALG